MSSINYQLNKDIGLKNDYIKAVVKNKDCRFVVTGSKKKILDTFKDFEITIFFEK